MKKILFILILLLAIDVYAEEKCYVTFQYDEIKTIEVTCGEMVIPLEIDIKDDQEFLGWYLGEELFDFETLITSDVLLVAKYESNVGQVDNLSNNQDEGSSTTGNFYYDMSDGMKKVLLFSVIGVAGLFQLVIIPKIKSKRINK